MYYSYHNVITLHNIYNPHFNVITIHNPNSNVIALDHSYLNVIIMYILILILTLM